MAKPEEPYRWMKVESFIPKSTSGPHGLVHIRPCPNQGFPTTLRVECSKKLSRDYPVGTRFRIYAKLTDMLGGGANTCTPISAGSTTFWPCPKVDALTL